MRLLRYDDPLTALSVELHPLLNVISGMPVDARERFISSMSAIARGELTADVGLVDVHGVLLELGPDTMSLLELTTQANPADVIVRAEDLAAPLSDAPPERDSELEGAQGALALAQGALADAERNLERLEAESRAAAAEHLLAESELEALRGEDDPTATAAMAAAAAELEDLRRRRLDAAILAAAAERQEQERRVEVLAAELRALTANDRELDEGQVASALERWREVADDDPVEVPEARSLAALLAESAAELSELQSRTAGGRSRLLELTAQRDAAYDALVAAEDNLRSPQLDQAVVTRLEAVHDEIFDMEGRSSRLSAGRQRRRVGELRAIEERLLADLGFETWSLYIMGVASPTSDGDRQQRYEVAKASYEFAEDELARAAGDPVHDVPELTSAERRVSELREQAAVLLGRQLGDDPVAELRAHVVPAGSLRGSIDEAVIALRVAVIEAGVTLNDPSDQQELVGAAEGFLAAADRRLAEADERRKQTGELAEQLAAERTKLAEVLSPAELRVELADDDPEVGAIRARMDDSARRIERNEQRAAHVAAQRVVIERLRSAAESVVEAAESARRDLTRLVADLERANSQLTAVEERNRVAEIERAAQRLAARKSAAATADVEGVEWSLLARIASQRSVSFVGSMPLVIDDALSTFSFDRIETVYDRLARMSDVVQIFVLTDDPAVSSWASGLGSRSAQIDLSDFGDTF